MKRQIPSPQVRRYRLPDALHGARRLLVESARQPISLAAPFQWRKAAVFVGKAAFSMCAN